MKPLDTMWLVQWKSRRNPNDRWISESRHDTAESAVREMGRISGNNSRCYYRVVKYIDGRIGIVTAPEMWPPPIRTYNSLP
jgi:hypothetical protein